TAQKSKPEDLLEIVGESQTLRAVFDLIRRVAETDAPVLIQGESGTGKELFARVIHRQSARNQGPFVVVNCAAIPEGLLASEFFGSAPSGSNGTAVRAKTGLFLQANGGTLVLDEVGNLPPE